MTRAPSAFAIASAAVETPPPMPQASTHSPSRRPARVTSIRYAVSKTSGKAAASSKLRLVGDGVDVRRGHGDQLGVRAVAVLADHVDPAAARLDAGVEDDALAGLEAADAVAERLDDARAVGAEDARLRDGRQALADPDVEMVERGGAEADEHLARPGHRIGRLLEHEHLRAAVLMDPNRAHRGRLSA